MGRWANTLSSTTWQGLVWRRIFGFAPAQCLPSVPIHGVILSTSETFIAPANSRLCTSVLSYFRSTATKLFCPEHGAVQAVTAVTNVIQRGEQTKYAVRLECDCPRDLFYTKVRGVSRRPVEVEVL